MVKAAAKRTKKTSARRTLGIYEKIRDIRNIKIKHIGNHATRYTKNGVHVAAESNSNSNSNRKERTLHFLVVKEEVVVVVKEAAAVVSFSPRGCSARFP